jgi:hypothetical protein
MSAVGDGMGMRVEVEARGAAVGGNGVFVDVGSVEIVSGASGEWVISMEVSVGCCTGKGIHPTSHRSKPKDRTIFLIYLMLDKYDYKALFNTLDHITCLRGQVKHGRMANWISYVNLRILKMKRQDTIPP